MLLGLSVLSPIAHGGEATCKKIVDAYLYYVDGFESMRNDKSIPSYYRNQQRPPYSRQDIELMLRTKSYCEVQQLISPDKQAK